MSYIALYRSYRPQTFEEVVGQKNIIKTLRNSLTQNKIAHAYLFCGPRGTGKTTLAKLFAKALNCEEGVSHQCNVCSNCKEITAGIHPDVMEIDAASNNGVEQVRDLIEKIKYLPLKGRYKVYIIDEVHQMSASAFNALLKTLEEPPANVIFILATTEPQKILPTILSRVQRYDFTKVSCQDIVERMTTILQQEKIPFEIEALQTIASLADGGVRDALSLLDKAISFSGNSITVKQVFELFGLMSTSAKLDLINSIATSNIKDALNQIKNLSESGVDILRLHDSLISILKDLLIILFTKDSALLTTLTVEEAQSMKLETATIKTYLDLLFASRREYNSSLNIFDHFEMTIIKMMTLPSVSASSCEVVLPDLSELKKSLLEELRNQQVQVETLKPPTKQVTPTQTLVREEIKVVEQVKIDIPVKSIVAVGELITLTEADIINIMVQGSRVKKEELLSHWNKIESYSSDPKYRELASLLVKSTPRVVAMNAVILEPEFQSIITKINAKDNQLLLQSFFEALFDFKPYILAINKQMYQAAVVKFKEYSQISKLPAGTPIYFEITPGKSANKISKTEEFANSIIKGEE